MLNAIKAHFEKEPKASTAVLHLEPLSVANSKAVAEAVKHVASKMKDKNVYLFAAEASTEGAATGGATQDGAKIVHGCHVSEDARGKGADASEWSSKVAAVVGGKAGGRGPTSLGQGVNTDQVEKAVEVAREYLDKMQIS